MCYAGDRAPVMCRLQVLQGLMPSYHMPMPWVYKVSIPVFVFLRVCSRPQQTCIISSYFRCCGNSSKSHHLCPSYLQIVFYYPKFLHTNECWRAVGKDNREGSLDQTSHYIYMNQKTSYRRAGVQPSGNKHTDVIRNTRNKTQHILAGVEAQTLGPFIYRFICILYATGR